MAESKLHLRLKAEAIAKSVEQMNEKERGSEPSRTFAVDYNRLREMVVEAAPEIKNLLPPQVKFFTGSYGIEHVEQSYQEIASFCRQIAAMLS